MKFRSFLKKLGMEHTKKAGLLLGCIAFVAVLTGCSADTPEKQSSEVSGQTADTASGKQEETQQTATDVDIDLTIMSGTMVYSEVFSMLNAPANYMGKTIKMSGAFNLPRRADG